MSDLLGPIIGRIIEKASILNHGSADVLSVRCHPGLHRGATQRRLRIQRLIDLQLLRAAGVTFCPVDGRKRNHPSAISSDVFEFSGAHSGPP